MDCAGIEKSIYGKDRKRTKVYYCHPYSAYERGTNENINKMISGGSYRKEPTFGSNSPHIFSASKRGSTITARRF